jgi:hypothetical protein
LIPFDISRIDADGVKSLVWRDGALVDWVGGNRVFPPHGDGTSNMSWCFRFDAAEAGPQGWACIHERRGTKGALLRGGECVREIDRSFDMSEDFDFPVAFGEQSGRVLLAHCPKGCYRLAIEDAATGEQLASGFTEEHYHSRLSFSPDGKRILSAGWVWHPVQMVVVYDVADGQLLYESDALGAAWLTGDRLALALDDGRINAPVYSIATVDLVSKKTGPKWQLAEPAGTMMAIDQDHVICFYRHPKLVDLRTGEVVQAWPEVFTGTQIDSIQDGDPPPPPLALDPANRRFAVADATGITSITLR